MFKYRILFLVGFLMDAFIMYMSMLCLHQIILDDNFLSFDFIFVVVFISFLMYAIHSNFDCYNNCTKNYESKRMDFSIWYI